MNILEKIVVRKNQEIQAAKRAVPIQSLEKHPYFSRQPYSLAQSLRDKQTDGQPGIIAEFKRRSPSKGIINDKADVEQVTMGYVAAGAVCLSILTDVEFFAGSEHNLHIARQHNNCPILRKDFMVDPYQVTEAKAMGADVILLIAAILTPAQVKAMAELAHSFGMEVLLEVHDEGELRRTALDDQIAPHIDVVGVNNRNLKNFEVSIQTSVDLAGLIPPEMVKISESGMSHAENIHTLMQHGYQGFLIGETFMKTEDPATTCQQFISQL